MSPSHCNRTITSIANITVPEEDSAPNHIYQLAVSKMPQAKSTSNSSCKKRDESQDNSCNCSKPSDSPARSPSSPTKPSPFAAFKRTPTGRLIAFKGRARTLESYRREMQLHSSQSKES